jgi:hypothetical protein
VEKLEASASAGQWGISGPLQEPQVPEERGASWLWPIRGKLQASGQFCYTWQRRPAMGRSCQTSDTDLLSFLQRKSTELYFETTSTRLSRSRFQRHFERVRCGNVDRSNGANGYLQVPRASRKLRLSRSRHLAIPSCLSLCPLPLTDRQWTPNAAKTIDFCPFARFDDDPRARSKRLQVWPDRALCSGNTDTREEDTRTSMLLPAHNGSASHGL